MEVARVLLRMLAAAIDRVGGPDRRRHFYAGWAIVAHTGPEPSGPGSSMTRSKQGNGRVVGMDLGREQTWSRIWPMSDSEAGWWRRPSWPVWSNRDPRPDARRSLTGDRAVLGKMHRDFARHACCPGSGGALREFGEDGAEMLEYVPESFKVIGHVRPKFCCKRGTDPYERDSRIRLLA